MMRRLFAVGVLAVAATARAQVDCSNPDNLCTGDPCVIPPIEVQVPCVVDFGTRTLEIPGILRVPAGPPPNNDVSFTAGRIEIRGGIRIARGRLPDVPGEVTLTAINDFVSPGRYSAPPGPRFHVFASGNIDLQARVRRNTLGTVEAGGTLSLPAGPTLQTCEPLRGAGGVAVGRRLRCATGSTLEISSSAGGVTLDATIDVRAPASNPSGLAVFAAGDVVTSILPLMGGGISLVSTGGFVFVSSPIRATQIQIAAAGDVTVGRELFAHPGDITIQGAGVDVPTTGRLDTSGSGFGAGDVRVTATAADLTLGGAFSAQGESGTPGGVIEGVAAGNVVANGVFDATGIPPGCISFQAGGTVDTSGGSFDPALVPDCPG
jgi:hypothetical protein